MKYFLFFFIFLFLSHNNSSVSAQSSYVLPYPAVMPGSMWYKVDLIQEILEKYWYFGNFSQFSYYINLSDKYLIEAKVLFEYKQYLLGINALKKSDSYYPEAFEHLQKAKDEGKNITKKRSMLEYAALKHIELLKKMKNETPSEVIWTPEKELPTYILLHDALDSSMRIREKI